jgi:large subunit ribosomal protein L18
MKMSKKKSAHIKRKKRVRMKINGTSERPRLTVFRSSHHIYAQIIDDGLGVTLVSASSVESETRSEKPEGAKTGMAKLVGKRLAEKAKVKGISKVAMDTNGYRYHGRVKALSDAAREAGLVF